MTLLLRTRHQRPSFVGTPLTQLGLFVTQGELEIWNARARGQEQHNFHAKGDSYPNSPNDWNRIVSWKNDFTANPGAHDNWTPNDGYPDEPIDLSEPGVNRAPQPEHAGGPGKVMAAAFWAMVLGSVHLDAGDRTITTTTRDNIIADIEGVLLTYANSQFLDTSVTPRWRLTNQVVNKPGYRGCFWHAEMLHAYDWCQIANPDVMSTANKQTIIAWFASFIPWYYGDKNLGMRDGTINLTTGVATSSGASADGAAIWNGSDQKLKIHQRLDNKIPPMQSLCTLIALEDELEDQRDAAYTLQMSAGDRDDVYSDQEVLAKHWLINEFVAAHKGNSGGQGSGNRAGFGQMYRGMLDASSSDGIKYAFSSLGRLLIGVDAMARAGKADGYTFSTTQGVGGGSGINTAGSVFSDTYFSNPGDKTLHRGLQQVSRFWIEGGTDSHPWRFGANSTNTNQRIDSTASTGDKHSEEWEILPFNMKFNDPKLTAIWDRSAANTPNHDPNPKSGAHPVEMGPSGMFFPNFQYMYVAGRVNPYPGGD